TPRQPRRGPDSGRRAAIGWRARSPCRRRSRTFGPAWSRSRDRAGKDGWPFRPPRRTLPARSRSSRGAPIPCLAAATPTTAAHMARHGRGREQPRSRLDPRAVRVVERLAGDLEPDPVAEDLDLATGPDRGIVAGQIGIRDRALDRESVAARRDAPDDAALDADGLVAERDRQRIVEHEAAESLARARGAGDEERLAADEVDVLVEVDG